jgi:hypothetical protein
MLGEEEGLYGDLIGRSSGRRSDGCGRAARSGSGGGLNSCARETQRKMENGCVGGL